MIESWGTYIAHKLPTIVVFQELGFLPVDQPLPSIFHDASITKCIDAKNSHMLNPAGTMSSMIIYAATHYTQDGEGLFALANNAGNIVMVKMPPLGMQG